jgi:hypothetical protein
VFVGCDKVQIWNIIPPKISHIPAYKLQQVQCLRGNAKNVGIFRPYGLFYIFWYRVRFCFIGLGVNPHHPVPIGLLLMDRAPHFAYNSSARVKTWTTQRNALFSKHSENIAKKQSTTTFQPNFAADLYMVFQERHCSKIQRHTCLGNGILRIWK